MNFGGQIADVSSRETSLVACGDQRDGCIRRLVLVYYSTVNPTLSLRPQGQKQNLHNLRLFCDDIKKKGEFFRYKIQFLQVSIFSFLGFAKFEKFLIKTSTELVKFYSLITENKEHHMLRVKMLTTIIMAIFFQFIQLVENQHILINSYLSFLGNFWACSCVEKIWETKFSESQFPVF